MTNARPKPLYDHEVESLVAFATSQHYCPPGQLRHLQSEPRSSRSHQVRASSAARSPLLHWALDVVEPMPSVPGNKNFIITAINYVTRWPIAWATVNHMAASVTRFIGHKIIGSFGCPNKSSPTEDLGLPLAHLMPTVVDKRWNIFLPHPITPRQMVG